VPELWERAREISATGRLIKLLSREDTLFGLAFHNRRFGKVLCLKNVYDAALLLHKYQNSFDWDYCLGMSKKYDFRATLFFILFQVELLAGIKVPGDILERSGLSTIKKKSIRGFIEENTFSGGGLPEKNKALYLKSHFLLYDSLWQPVEYILNIPQEQFAKYYGLKPYAKGTEVLYRLRFAYILFKSIFRG